MFYSFSRVWFSVGSWLLSDQNFVIRNTSQIIFFHLICAQIYKIIKIPGIGKISKVKFEMPLKIMMQINCESLIGQNTQKIVIIEISVI